MLPSYISRRLLTRSDLGRCNYASDSQPGQGLRIHSAVAGAILSIQPLTLPLELAQTCRVKDGELWSFIPNQKATILICCTGKLRCSEQLRVHASKLLCTKTSDHLILRKPMARLKSTYAATELAGFVSAKLCQSFMGNAQAQMKQSGFKAFLSI